MGKVSDYLKMLGENIGHGINKILEGISELVSDENDIEEEVIDIEPFPDESRLYDDETLNKIEVIVENMDIYSRIEHGNIVIYSEDYFSKLCRGLLSESDDNLRLIQMKSIHDDESGKYMIMLDAIPSCISNHIESYKCEFKKKFIKLPSRDSYPLGLYANTKAAYICGTEGLLIKITHRGSIVIDTKISEDIYSISVHIGDGENKNSEVVYCYDSINELLGILHIV